VIKFEKKKTLKEETPIKKKEKDTKVAKKNINFRKIASINK